MPREEEEPKVENGYADADADADAEQGTITRAEHERCIRWVREQMRWLQQLNRVYEEKIIGEMEPESEPEPPACVHRH